MKLRSIAPIAAALAAVALWAQTPQQPQQQRPPQTPTPQQPAAEEVPRTASISGAVVAIGTNQPIPGATVEIRRADCSNFSNPPDVQTATTDAKGNFTFQKLRAGGWCVVASAHGGQYMPAEYMQRGYKERGATLPVLEGQSVTDIQLALAPTGGISGRIMDRDAEPMAHARVQLLEPYYEDGRRKLFILQSVPTNDLGTYRFFWVPPGRYYIAVTPEDNRGRQTTAVIPQPGAGGRREETVPPVITKKVEPNGSVTEETAFTVYYPGEVDPDHAAPIDLGPGADVAGIDFLLVRSHGQSFHVRGTLTNGINGQPATGAQIRIVPKDWRASIVMPTGSADAKGNFDIAGVLPGFYVLYANMAYRPPADSPAGGPTLPTAPRGATPAPRGATPQAAPAPRGAAPQAGPATTPGPRGNAQRGQQQGNGNGRGGQTAQGLQGVGVPGGGNPQGGQGAQGGQRGQGGGQGGNGAPPTTPISVRIPLNVGYAHVDDLNLTLVAGFDLPGKAQIEHGPSEFPRGVTISLARDPDIVGAPAQGRGGAIQQDATFTLNGVGPGDYRVLVAPFITAFQWAPPQPPKAFDNMYLKSVRYDGEEVLSGGLHLGSVPSSDLEIVFATGGTVTGSVVNEQRDPLSNVIIALVPEAQYRKRLDLYRTVSTDHLGRFKITGVAPGQYKAFAWEEVERNAWQVEDFLQPVENRGLPVDVREGGESMADITAIRAAKP